MNAPLNSASNNRKTALLLPNLNSPMPALFVDLVGELFAIILTLAQPGIGIDWQYLGLISLRIQWLSLTGILLISLIQRYLRPKKFWQLSLVISSAILLFNLLIDLVYFSYFSQLRLNEYSTQEFDFIAKNLCISGIVLLFLLRYFYLQHLYQLRLRSESESRFKALQARIHPHFLFNALNAITSLVSIDAHKAEEMLENLADLLRASLNENSQMHSLDHELSLCRKYLDIERCRFADRLEVNWYYPDKLPSLKVPVLILQPLLENAIIHGISPSIEGGTINITIDLFKDICVTIENPYHEHYRSHSSGFKIALANCEERLKLRFGEEARITTEHNQSVWTTQLFIPKNTLQQTDA